MNPKHEAAMKDLMTIINGDLTKDSFRVKIGWKPNFNGLPETFCIFDRVTSELLSLPETWLSVLADNAGGVYEIDIFHMDEVRKRIGDGFSIAMNLDRALQVRPAFNWAGFRTKGYAGPTHIISPAEPTKTEEPLKVTTQMGSPTRPYAVAERDDIQRRETELLVRESEARILSAMSARAPVAAAPTSTLESLTPLITTYLKESGENRRADAQAAREERREQAERDRAARADADARFEKLLVALKPAPPPPQDPIITQLLTKALNRDESSTLKAQAEGMAATTGAMLQIIHTQAELQQMNAPQEDSPLMKLLGKGIDALVALNGGQMPTDAEQPQEEAPALAEGGEQAAAEPDDGETPLIKLEKALRMMRPGEEIADLFCACLKDAEFMSLRARQKGWAEFIDSRMGAWTAKAYEKRSQYLGQVLMGSAFPTAVKRGLMQPPGARPAPAAAATPAATPVKKPNGQKRPTAKAAAPKGEVEDAELVDEKPAAPPAPEPTKAAEA